MPVTLDHVDRDQLIREAEYARLEDAGWIPHLNATGAKSLWSHPNVDNGGQKTFLDAIIKLRLHELERAKEEAAYEASYDSVADLIDSLRLAAQCLQDTAARVYKGKKDEAMTPKYVAHITAYVEAAQLNITRAREAIEAYIKTGE